MDMALTIPFQLKNVHRDKDSKALRSTLKGDPGALEVPDFTAAGNCECRSVFVNRESNRTYKSCTRRGGDMAKSLWKCRDKEKLSLDRPDIHREHEAIFLEYSKGRSPAPGSCESDPS